jgi:hypothetical protein
MTAFNRQPSPDVIHHAKGAPVLIDFRIERETAAVMRTLDPYMHGVDPCVQSAEHYLIRSGGDLVCANCERVFWRLQF